MSLSAEAITAYQEYNGAINAVLFDGQFAGTPLYLDIEGPLCDRIAEQLGKTPDDFIRGLARAVRNSLNWDKPGIFDWHTDMSKRWEYAGRANPPPFTALLCALSVAAERMRHDDKFQAHNYYQRLFTYLSIMDQNQKNKVTFSFKATPPLWKKLNRWLSDKEGELGRPTAQQVNGFVNVSYAISQALIRDAERQNLHAMFVHFCFAPREQRSPSEMEVYLEKWIKSHRGTSTLARLWRSSELHDRLSSAACEELQAWDGAEAVNADGVRTYSPAWVCYVDSFPPPASIYLNLTVPTAVAGQIGTLSAASCRSLRGTPLLSGIDAAFEFEAMEDDGLASLEPSKKVWAAALLQESFEFTNTAGTVRLRKSSSPFILFRNADSGGLYKEVSRLSLLEPHLILCRQEWQARVSKYLTEAARPGFTPYNAQTLKYLPAGWVAFAGVEIVRHIHTDNDLQVLVPLAETSLVLQRGVRLADEVWHEDGAPEVLAASSDAPLRLELSTGTGAARQVLAEASTEESCVRLDLRGIKNATIEPATITVSHGKKELKHKAILLTSADKPRSLDVLTIPPLGYRLSGNSAGALLSAGPANDTNLSLTGLIIHGTASRIKNETDVSSVPADAPSFESDEEERTVTFDANASSSGKETCAVRGHHYWIVEPHESGQHSWDAKWLDCRDCRKHYVAKNRLKKRKVEPVLPARKRVIQPPQIERLTEIRPSIDTVYDALCYLGGGRFPRLAQICGQASEKPFFVSRFTSNLVALGHIDVQNDNVTGPPAAWRCAPPAIVELTEDSAVLTGYRSKSLCDAVKCAVENEGGTFSVCAQEAAPAAYIISGLTPAQLEKIARSITDAHGRSLVFSTNPAALIAQYAPSMSDLVPMLKDTYIRAGDPVERFDPATGRWCSANSTNEAGGYRSTGGARLYAIRTKTGELKRGSYRVVKLLAANMSGLRIHGYNPEAKVFVSPLGCDPLPLLERALVACSGQLPEVSRGRLLYKSVSADIAYPIIQKLYG